MKEIKDSGLPVRKSIREAYNLGSSMSEASGLIADFNATAETVRNLRIDDIELNPHQPRKHFDQKDLEQLCASIREHGVIQPIIVRIREDGKVELVAGEMRWRAAKMAGLQTVKAVTTRGDSAEISLIENIQRYDLNVIEFSEALQSLQTTKGYSQIKLAAIIGKEQPTVSKILKLNTLPENVKDILRKDKSIPFRLAYELLKLTSEEEMLSAVVKYTETGDLPEKKKPARTKSRRSDARVGLKISKMSTVLQEIRPEKLSETGRNELRTELEKLRANIDGLLGHELFTRE